MTPLADGVCFSPHASAWVATLDYPLRRNFRASNGSEINPHRFGGAAQGRGKPRPLLLGGDMTDLKLVGEIKPPDFKDPATMLRNIANDIEAGVYGEVYTVVVALADEGGYETFGGGLHSSMEHCAFLFASAAARMHVIPWKGD